jgi:RNA methyltransferase, TrmH family
MLSTAHIKKIRLLHQKKHRTESGLFIAEGVKVVAELLKSNYNVKEILALPQWIDQNSSSLPANLQALPLTPKELARISTLSSPNMVLAVAEKPPDVLPDYTKVTGFMLMLDGIADPGNLGTILRTADWFGVDTVLCSPDCVEVYNPKVIQATMGSAFRVKTIYTDLAQVIDEIKGLVPVYGTFLSGENCYQTKFGSKGAIVIGSESHGISPIIESLVQKRLHIPTLSPGAESLNAAVACALVCAEINRASLIKI